MRPSTVLLALCVLLTSSLALITPEDQPISSGPVHATHSWSWESCGLDTDSVQIQSIEVNPDPPKPGKDLTVTVHATVKEEISEGAYIDVTVKLGRIIIKLLQKTFDICEEARNANAAIQCPVTPGSYTVVQTVALPYEIPRTKFSVDVLGDTADNEPLTCVKLTVNFFKLN